MKEAEVPELSAMDVLLMPHEGELTPEGLLVHFARCSRTAIAEEAGHFRKLAQQIQELDEMMTQQEKTTAEVASTFAQMQVDLKL